MRLSKHHGLGNDFLIAFVDAIPADAPERARRWCHRTTGIGADGLVFGTVEGDEPRFTLFNADGGRAEISGNGLRCFGQALARSRYADLLATTVHTDAGPRRVVVQGDPNAETVDVTVEMGPVRAGVDLDAHRFPELSGARRASFDLGNPHVVFEVDDPDAVDLAVVGPAVESNFADGMNVHVMRVDEGRVRMRPWERGVGLTQACGSGACAVAAAAAGWGLIEGPVPVSMPGGEVVVQVGEQLLLQGPATHVADIEVTDG